jgi:hypothetical protein
MSAESRTTQGMGPPRRQGRGGEAGAASSEARSFRPGPPRSDVQRQLEAGEVVVLTGLKFDPDGAGPQRIAEAACDRAKNISFNPVTGALKGAAGDEAAHAWLAAVLAAYSGWALNLVWERLPAYAPHLAMGKTSFRPRPADAAVSPRKDDRRLHVDSFPSQPVQGRRILRVFHNINPWGEDRVWQVGEGFTDYAARFLPAARPPRTPGWLLQALGLTKGRRTAYDALMLALHDAAKADAGYQADAPRKILRFPPGATWLVFTDAAPHAALSGRFALEQTFLLPVEAMADPDETPLRVLERMTGRPLA